MTDSLKRAKHYAERAAAVAYAQTIEENGWTATVAVVLTSVRFKVSMSTIWRWRAAS
jgi:hypothetical protein